MAWGLTPGELLWRGVVRPRLFALERFAFEQLTRFAMWL